MPPDGGLRVGLAGHPLGHSLSPALQDAAFRALGLPYRYRLYDLPAASLRSWVGDLRGGGWLGCNVTVPYKTAVAPLLDELRGAAQVLGAVNTISIEAGRLIGHNTDAQGFAEDLATHPELEGQPGGAVVLGAGGAARAVVWTLLSKGWRVHVLARRGEQAVALQGSLPGPGAAEGIVPGVLCSRVLVARLAQARLLVNCTPAGMFPQVAADPLPSGVVLSPHLFVYDLIYRPAKTQLLARAEACGCGTANGLPMLVAQGAAAFTIWTGLAAPRARMRAAAEQALQETGEAIA